LNRDFLLLISDLRQPGEKTRTKPIKHVAYYERRGAPHISGHPQGFSQKLSQLNQRNGAQRHDRGSKLRCKKLRLLVLQRFHQWRSALAKMEKGLVVTRSYLPWQDAS
jgi:hypothetical protein